MKFIRKLSVIAAAFTFLTFLPIFTLAAAPQALSSVSANARGQGTLTMGKEVFKIHAVVVNLKGDGTGEIILVTDFTLFVNCTWAAPADSSKGIELKITGGTTASGAEGSGKLFLRPDGKSIDKLSMMGSSKTQKRRIQLNFVAE